MKTENHLLDHIAHLLQAKNDAALAAALGVSAPVISKIRHGRLPVGAALVIKVHEATAMTVPIIKSFITHGPQVVKC